ncbi:MAG: hypothetical protein RLP44_26910 [Aggregatilineales bacterium]
MTETLKFHTLDELKSLSLTDLQALWELVPTDRQKAYRAAYDREVRNANALGSDELERRVASELLRRYDDSALVPVGSRWARTPARVQDAARSNDSLETKDDSTHTRAKPSAKVIIIAMMLVIVVGFVMMRVLGGGGGSDLNAESTEEPTTSPTPEISPTPTPLALEAQDDVISGGDSSRETAYPVNLQITLPDESAPRVWVVQRRAVRTAEWNYDFNPDIASFVSGMAVRPVIGIPFSEDNANWFAQMANGTNFTLTMNTGAILRYEFADKTDVRRSETDIFRQIEPGLVLLLIGETDENGLPTATRTLVTATYSEDQELSRTGELLTIVDEPTLSAPEPTPTPSATPDPSAYLDVQVVSVTTIDGQLTTRLRVYNGGTSPITFTQDDIWLSLGYAPNPVGPRVPAEGLQSFELLPEQAVDLTLVWAWDEEPFATLCIGEWQFGLMIE